MLLPISNCSVDRSNFSDLDTINHPLQFDDFNCELDIFCKSKIVDNLPKKENNDFTLNNLDNLELIKNEARLARSPNERLTDLKTKDNKFKKIQNSIEKDKNQCNSEIERADLIATFQNNIEQKIDAKENKIFKLVNSAKQNSSVDTSYSVDSLYSVDCNIINASFSKTASETNSTEYGGGGSDRYAYNSHRGPPSRNIRDREQEMRDPVEPIDQHHYHIRHHRESSVKRGQFTRSLSNSETPGEEKTGKCILVFNYNFIQKYNSQTTITKI